MKSLFSGNFRCLLLCTALGMGVGEAAANTIGISDNPLQTAVGVPPNVLFVIDDSFLILCTKKHQTKTISN